LLKKLHWPTSRPFRLVKAHATGRAPAAIPDGSESFFSFVTLLIAVARACALRADVEPIRRLIRRLPSCEGWRIGSVWRCGAMPRI
jgi:hypothetical protein